MPLFGGNFETAPSKQRGKSEDFCIRNNWFDIGTSSIHLDIEIKLLI